MPNRTRKSFNPKRALVVVKPLEADLIVLAERVSYGGNPEHKSGPGDFGLTPPSAPRGDKTLCDKAGIGLRSEALSVLRSGVRKGLISRQTRGRFPQNIWAVTDDGTAFEAQLENPDTGSYHGYPMPRDDDFRATIVCGLVQHMSEFEISVDDWLARIHGNAIEQATLAQIELRHGGRSLFQLEDRLARTSRPFANLSAYDLAAWLAGNWWRLRWEPERPGVEWRMAHSLAAIGGGYVWPAMTLASDGEQIRIQARPTSGEKWEPIRYLDSWNLSLPAVDFELALDSFIEMVLARLANFRITATDLHQLWEELRAERLDPGLTSIRRLEALLGFDPGTAPDSLLDNLLDEAHQEGPTAVDEVVAGFADAAPMVLKQVDDGLKQHGTRLHSEKVKALAAHIDARKFAGLPWQRAAEAARMARGLWNMDGRPVPNDELVGLVGADVTLITGEALERLPMGAARRVSDDGATWDAVLRSHPETGRRFELCRLIADSLLAPGNERLLPVTKAKTSRQKFQRSFAQEFLCPFHALMEKLGAPSPDNPPEEEDIDDAARYFNVSNLVIQSTLANHDILPRF